MATSESIPVLFDTDIGSDIDDAVALAYLLSQPRCELLGITTFTGDVQKRAALAEIVCRAAGRDDVPIHCGHREPLANGCGQPYVPQYDAVADLPHRLDRPEQTAVGFLRDAVRSRPGEVVLLTVGPLANVAFLFALDPEIPALLRGLVSMAGVFFAEGRREWNVLVDPEAAARVYAARRPDHLSIGLDVTERCRMDVGEVAARFVGEPLATVRRMAEGWFADNERMTFHDPLAAAALFRPEILTERRGRIEVEETGTTRFAPGEGADRVAENVDVDAFFEEYFSVFVPENLHLPQL